MYSRDSYFFRLTSWWAVVLVELLHVSLDSLLIHSSDIINCSRCSKILSTSLLIECDRREETFFVAPSFLFYKTAFVFHFFQQFTNSYYMNKTVKANFISFCWNWQFGFENFNIAKRQVQKKYELYVGYTYVLNKKFHVSHILHTPY